MSELKPQEIEELRRHLYTLSPDGQHPRDVDALCDMALAASPETAARLEKLEAALELADACIVAERKRVWSTVDSVANGDFEKAFIVALSQSQVPEQVKVYNQDKRARAALLQHLKENP